jgi:hypothetical protein
VAAEVGLEYRANEATRRPRDILETNGSGCAFLDYDGDGRLDILLVGKPKCALFRNEGERFRDVTREAGLDAEGHWIGVGAADWDNDGDPDLCLSGYRTGAMYRNDGGRFTDVTAASGVRFPKWGQSPAFADTDNDGLVDLFISAYAEFGPDSPRYCARNHIEATCGPELYRPELGRLFRNLGGGRFEDVTRRAGLTNAHGRSWGAAFQDFNDDGRQDLYVANDMIACDLFENLGGGRFRNIGLASSTAYDGNGNRIGGMAADWADYDGDGLPDLLVTAFSAQHSVLFRQVLPGTFQDASDQAGVSQPTIPYVGFGGKFIDFDNDGRRDLFLANGHIMDNVERLSRGETYRQPLQLLRNAGSRFEDMSRRLRDLPAVVARGAAFGDYDNDGRVDVLVMDLEGPPLLLRNRAEGGSWIGFILVGGASNREGIGARLLVRTAGRMQRLECQTSGSLTSCNDPRVVVGLGSASQVDEVEIRWPSGETSRLQNPPLRRYLVLREPG